MHAHELIRRARLQLRPLAAGEWVFRPGDPADAIYLLLGARAGGEGLHVDPLVQIELKPPSGKRSLRFERIVHGEVFGELELLEQGLSAKAAKRTTSAFALTPSCIVPLPLALIGALVEADHIFRARLIRIGSQRLLATLKQQHDKARSLPRSSARRLAGRAVGGYRHRRRQSRALSAQDRAGAYRRRSRREPRDHQPPPQRMGALGLAAHRRAQPADRDPRLSAHQPAGEPALGAQPRRARADHRRYRRGDRLRRPDPRAQYRPRYLALLSVEPGAASSHRARRGA